MTDTITFKEHPDEFKELCEAMGIAHPSTVNRFERGVHGIYAPVLWSDVKVEKSATERVLR